MPKMEKEMVTDSTIVIWKIPWTEDPGGLQSTGLQRVGARKRRGTKESLDEGEGGERKSQLKTKY